MKTIEHNPLPDYGEGEWARKKYGDPRPSDLFVFIAPIAFIVIILFLVRGY